MIKVIRRRNKALIWDNTYIKCYPYDTAIFFFSYLHYILYVIQYNNI